MKTKVSRYHGRSVEQFLAEHGGDVTGVISGFDRLRLARRWRRATSARLGRTVKLPPLSPKTGYTQGIGPPLARSPTTKTGGYVRRAAAVLPLAACSPRRVAPNHTAPPLGSKHIPHKRCRPAAVTRDGLVQPASRFALRRSRTLGVGLVLISVHRCDRQVMRRRHVV